MADGITSDMKLGEAKAQLGRLRHFAESFRFSFPEVEEAARAGAKAQADELERFIQQWVVRERAPQTILKEVAEVLRSKAARDARATKWEIFVEIDGDSVAGWGFEEVTADRIADLIDPPKLPTATADEPDGEGE